MDKTLSELFQTQSLKQMVFPFYIMSHPALLRKKEKRKPVSSGCTASTFAFPIIVGLVVFAVVTGCNNNQRGVTSQDQGDNTSEVFSGIPGGHEGPPLTAGPPLDPDSWHKIPGTVLNQDQVWGNRINARTTFTLPGGKMGLLYSSHPGRDERQRDPEWRAAQLEQGLTTGPSGSIAFTHNLLDWSDYPENPILNEIQRSWQTPHRVHTRDLLYDPNEDRWVVYFGNIDPENSPGIREVGVTYSKDLVNWEYADGPLLTIEDYASFVPERIEATPEELDEHGRVYLGWGMYYNDRFYITLSGTETVGLRETGEDAGTVRSLSTGRVVLAGNTPEGPFEYMAHIDADNLLPGSKPVYWNGRWYSVFTGTWNDQPGFGLAWSDELFGPVTRNPHNPIITVESTQRSNPIFFHHEGTWGVLFSDGANWWEELPLRVAIANYHPSLLE